MKQFILIFIMALAFTANSQTLTLSADSTNATFVYTLDSAHEYKLTIEGFYKTPWVTIRPAFNPDN